MARDWAALPASGRHVSLTAPLTAAHTADEGSACAGGVRGGTPATSRQESQQQTFGSACPDFKSLYTETCGTPRAASHGHKMPYLAEHHSMRPPEVPDIAHWRSEVHGQLKERELSMLAASLRVGSMHRTVLHMSATCLLPLRQH